MAEWAAADFVKQKAEKEKAKKHTYTPEVGVCFKPFLPEAIWKQKPDLTFPKCTKRLPISFADFGSLHILNADMKKQKQKNKVPMLK